MQPTNTILAYCAGVLEGDGCIGIYDYHESPTQYLRVQLEMTHAGPPQLCRALFGGWVTVSSRRATTIWSQQGNAAADAIEQLLPFFYAKRDQAEAALRFAETLGERGPPRDATGAYARLPDSVDLLRVDTQAELKRLRQPPEERVQKSPPPHRFLSEREEDIAWLAGVFDAEGTMTISLRQSRNARHNYVLRAEIAATDPRLISRVQSTHSGSIAFQPAASAHPWRAVHKWVLIGATAARFLSRLSPWLLVKRQHVDIASAFVATYSGAHGGARNDAAVVAREQLRTALRALQRKGRQWGSIAVPSRLCACGCGRPVLTEAATYLRGHHPRK